MRSLRMNFETDNIFYRLLKEDILKLPKPLHENIVFVSAYASYWEDTHPYYSLWLGKDIDIENKTLFRCYLHNLTGEDKTLLKLLGINTSTSSARVSTNKDPGQPEKFFIRFASTDWYSPMCEDPIGNKLC